MEKDKQRELRRRTVGVTSDKVKRVLGGADGAELLKALRQQFPGEFHVDPCQHAYSAGQRSVVDWLALMADFTMED